VNGEAIKDQFFKALGKAQHAALLLDYDGTLAPFRIDRKRAIPYTGVRRTLQAIRERTNTRLVIISAE
jgi:trehalose 6-phosphate phosphatase